MSSPLEKVFQKRLEEHIQEIEEQNLVESTGPDSTWHISDNPRLIPEDKQIHDFSLSDLRQFGRYLCDGVLQPSSSITAIPIDYPLYWAWTGAYMAYIYHPEHQLSPSIEDFFSMVQFNLLSTRQTLLDERISRFIASMNPSIHSAQQQGLRLASTAGFSTLQGLVRRHCSQIHDSGGLRSPISNPSWRDEDNLDDQNRLNSANYFDELKVWQHSETTDVGDTLSEIDDMERYDIANLSNKMAGIEDHFSQEKGFLFALKNQRNANIHGELNSRVIGSIVLNLCCLIVWDFADQTDFEENREDLLNHIRAQQKMGNMSRTPPSPTAFYPIVS